MGVMDRYNEKKKKREEENTGGTTASGGVAERYERNKYYDTLDTGSVNEAYINSFVSDYNSFIDQHNSGSATYTGATSTLGDLGTRLDTIDGWLYKNRSKLTSDSYDSFVSDLGSIRSGISGIRDFYSQWDSEDAYNQAMAQQKDYEGKKTADLGALTREVDGMQSILDQMDSVKYQISLIRNMPSYAPGAQANASNLAYYESELAKLEAQYGSYDSIKSQISQKNAYINQASRIQKGIELASVTGNADFAGMSGYVSTKNNAWHSGLTSTFGMGYDDLTYEYINGKDNGMRSDIYQRVVSHDMDTDAYDLYDRMTDEQISIYNYHYATGGKDAAEEYLDSIIEALAYQEASERFGKMQGKTGLELLFSIEAGTDQFQSGIKNIFSGDDYIPTTATQYTSGMVREDLANAGAKLPEWMGGASIAQGAYDLATTTVNMAPSIMVSAVANAIAPGSGAIVGSALMGASSAGNAYQEALNMGYEKDQARAYSTLVGASEAGLQYLLGGIGKLGGKISGKTAASLASKFDNAFARLAVQYGMNMLSEGGEEYLQEILTPMFKNIALGTDEEINLISEEAIYSFLLGAISSGVMEGTGISSETGKGMIGNLIDMSSKNKANIEAVNLYGGSTQELIAEGLASEPGSESHQFAEIMQRKTDKGKSMTGYEIRQQVQANEAQFAVEDYNSAVETAKGRLTELGETGDVNKIAKLVVKKASGKGLTRAEKKILVNGFGSQVAKEIEAEFKNTVVYKPLTDRVGDAPRFGVSKSGQATVRATNEAIDLAKAEVVEVGESQITFKTESGTEVYAGDIDFADEDQSYLVSAVSDIENITPAAATAVIHDIVDTSKPLGPQLNGIDEAYTYGYHGYSVEDLKAGNHVSSLTDKQMMSAYRLGESARKISDTEADAPRIKMRTAAEAKLTAKQKTEKQKARFESDDVEVYFHDGKTSTKFEDSGKYSTQQMAAVNYAKLLSKLRIGGSGYHFYESYVNDDKVRVYKDANGNEVKAPNGMYIASDGSIWIDLNAGDNGQGTTLFTLGHELTHFIKQWSKEKFKVLADFLIEEYGKTDMSMHQRVLEKQGQLEDIRGEDVSYDEAFEEVVADAMSTMLTDGNLHEKLAKLKSKDKGLFNKIKQFFDKMIAKFQALYKGLDPEQKDARDVRAMKDAFERIQQAFAEALVEASDNFHAAMESVVEANAEPVGADEIITEGAVVTDGEGVRHSIRSMKHDIADGKMFRDLMDVCGWTQAQVGTLRTQLKDLVEYMVPYRNILDMNENYGAEGRRFSPYKPNSDPLYKISMDFSTLCSKRLLTQYVIEQLQLRENRPMSAEEQMAIRDMLNEYRKVEKGLQVACSMCYVEAARLKAPKQIQRWLNNPAPLLTDYFGKKNKAFNDAVKKAQADFKESKGYDREAPKKDMKQADVKELNKIGPKMRSQYQPSAEEQAIIDRAKTLPNSTYLTAGNLADLSETDPVIYDAYTAFVRTATRSKSLEKDEPYYYGDSTRDNGNGIVVTDSFIEAVNRENGMRFSSWSDWRIQHLLDYITAVIDNSVRGAAMHGYTKFGDEVRVLGKTGMMFNMSGVTGTQTGLNEDGSLNFSETESIDVNEAIQLRDEFPDTAGLQCIGVSDQHIVALLRSDIIDYVIPYHVSGLNADLRRMAKIYGWDDYTGTQHAAIDKSIKFENAVDKEHWHEEPVFSEFFVGYDTGMTGIEAMRASAEKYKQMCKDRGLTPKFNQFATEDNYWKLLIDRKMINQQTGKLIRQKAVTPTFDFDTIKGVVDKFVDNYDAGLEARALNHIVENWDTLPQRIKDLKKQGGTKAKKTKKAATTLANQTVAAQPKNSDRSNGFQEHDVVSAVYTIRNEKAKRGHDLVKIGTMPTLYRDLFHLDGDVYVSNEHLYQNMVSRATAEAEGRYDEKASADYHELGEGKIISAIEQFQDPLVIMESLKDYKEPRLVAILEEKGNDGQNLMAIMELYAQATYPGASQRRNHVLITIYEKNSLPDYIEKTVDKGRILYKKEGLRQMRQAGLQLAGETSEETLKKNVARFNKKVKDFKAENKIFYSDRDYMAAVERGDMETVQKMVDEAAKEAGYSVKVYHGTDQMGFTVFDPKKSDDKISLFFTDSQTVAKTYASHYAKVKPTSSFPEIKSFKYERGKKYTEAEMREAHDFIQSISYVYGVPKFNVENQTVYHAGTRYSAKQLMEMADHYSRMGLYEVFVNPDGMMEVDAENHNWNAIVDPDVSEYRYKINYKGETFNYFKAKADDAFTLELYKDGEAEYNGDITFSQMMSMLRKRLGDSRAEMAVRHATDGSGIGSKISERVFSDSNGNYAKKFLTTRDLAKKAKKKGYKGLIIKNVYDNGGKATGPGWKKYDVPSNLYIMFDSNQVKSADPVTYDESGNVIPLSERFKADNNDIRYSDRYNKIASDFTSHMQNIVKTNRGWYAEDVFKYVEEHPELGFIELIYAKDKDAKKLLEKFLGGIDDVKVLDQLSWFMGEAYGDKDRTWSWSGGAQYPYRGAVRTFRNAIKKRINAIMSENVGGTNLGIKNGEVELADIKSLYSKLNANEEIGQFAEKVFATAEKLGVNIRFTNQTMAKNVAGDNLGDMVEYKTSYFNDTAVPDQRKANTLLHELIHACTVYVMQHNPTAGDVHYSGIFSENWNNISNAATRLNRIYMEIESDPDFKGQYGITNAKEMVAELANEEFVGLLKKKNLWDRIVDWICELFGYRRGNSAYENARMCVDYILDNPEIDVYKNQSAIERRNAKYNGYDVFGQTRYSERTGDSVSNRFLLANALEGITQSSNEYKLIQEYKSHVAELNSLEAKLSEFNREIRKIRFGKGEYDAEKLQKIESEANKIAKAINQHDKKLLWLEASEPLRKVIERERKKEAQKTKDHVKEIQQNKKVRAEQTELRHKIRKAVRDLDKLLNRGNKKLNVKEDVQGVVSKALKAADILFTDHYGNYDMLRNGIGADLSDAEEALVATCTRMLKDLDKMPTDGYDNFMARQEAEKKLSIKMAKLKDVFARERKRLNNTTVSSILGELADAYASLEKSEQSYVQGAYIEAVHSFLKNLQSEVGGTVVSDMTKDQLESVYAAYKMVLTTVRKANQLFNEGLKMSREQLGNAVIEEVMKAGGTHGLWTKAEIARSQFDWNNMKPVWVANRIGSESFGKLWQGLFEGQYNFAKDIEEAKQFKLEMDKKYKPRSWDAEKQYKFMSSTGKEFSLNLQQIMSLYAFSKREQAYSHLLNGGFVFEGNSTVIVDEKGRKKTYIHNGATSYKLNEATLNGIINSLTKEQMAYVDEMQKYLSEVMGEKGNEVSMQLYGIKMFKEQFYFPLRSSGAYMERAKEAELKKQQGQINLVNSGFTHAVKPEAKNPIILSGFMDVWAEHCNEMSMYHSMVLPMEDFRKVYNYSTVHDERLESASVYQTIQDAYGNAATDYIDQLYRELNAGATVDPRETPFKALISKFKKASVMMSASVVVQQFSSIGRAYAVIDPRHFIGAKVNSDTKLSAVEEMKKYAPVAIIKEMGGFDTGTKGSAKSYIMAEKYGKGERLQGLKKDEQYRSDLMGYLPAKADEKTWCAIWEAAKREIKAKHPKMDVTSEEFLKLAGKRFSEVIEKTQVYDSVLARSANMRSKGAFMAMATAFMAEPTTTINLIEDAIRSGDKKHMARAFGSVAVSIVLNNALASIVYAMRDDDEDETLIEKYFQSFTAGMIDDFNPMSYYPFLKDVYSLFQGYDVERSDMSVIADVRDALKKAISVIGKDTSEMDDEQLAEHYKTITSALMSVVDAGCSMFGVPFKNVRRDAVGLVNAVTTTWKDMTERDTTWISFWDKVGAAAKDTVPILAWTKDKAKADKLYTAIIKGDQEYLARLKSAYKTDSAYQSAVRKALRENDPRIHEAAQARYEGRTEDYKRIFREIKNEGKFSFDEIMDAVNSEENAIRNKLEPDKATSQYSASDFVEAIVLGEAKNAKAMRDDIINAHMANDMSMAEAEEAFVSSVTSSIGDAYSSGLLDKAGAENMLIEYAGKDEEEAASKVNYWAFCEKYPQYDLSESRVAKFYEFAEPAGVSVDVYAQFINGTKDMGTIYDEWGDEVESKRDQVLDFIDSLPLTWQQKDALYLAFGYKESRIWDVPW